MGSNFNINTDISFKEDFIVCILLKEVEVIKSNKDHRALRGKKRYMNRAIKQMQTGVRRSKELVEQERG